MQGNPRELSIPRTVGVGLLFVVALTACAHFKGSPSPAAEAPARSAPDVQPSSDGQTAVAAPDTLPATPPASESPAAGSPATGGPPAVASPPPSPAPSTAKPAQPKTAGNANPRSPRGAGSPAGGSSKPLPAEQRGTPPAAQTAVAQPVAKPPAPPALDLAGLEQRLKDTHAIGLFTKLSLKNQVDDLLGAFRSFHGGQTQPPLAALRQRYDLLLLKVLTLLQDGDPPLASAISASREAIWGLLADRDKFQKIQMS
jgi:hypothetical protein